MNRKNTRTCFLIALLTGFNVTNSLGRLHEHAIPKGIPAEKHFNFAITYKAGSFYFPLINICERAGYLDTFTKNYNLPKAETDPNSFIRYTSDPTNYFRSRNSGAWTNVTTWESSTDNLTWINADLIPTAAAQGILIYNGHTVSLEGDVSAKSLTVAIDGTLSNPGPGGGFMLTIELDPNVTEAEFRIFGTYLLFGKQPVFEPGATAIVYGNALVRAEDNVGGGSDGFARNTSVFFKNKAVFEWFNTMPFATSGITYFPNAGATEIPVFKVSRDPGTIGTGLLIINGLLEVNTNFTFSGASNKLFRDGITGNSTLTQNTTNGNRFTIGGIDAILGGISLTLNLSFPMYLESSVKVPADSFVTVQGANINNAKTGNIFLIEGSLDATNIEITNIAGAVKIKGLYRTSNAGSINTELASIPSGIVTTLPGSTIEYYLNGNQFFKSRPDFTNIVFSGSGTKRASAGFDPLGILTIKDDAILNSSGQNIGDLNTRLVMTDNSRLILSTSGRNPSMDGGYNLSGGVIQFDNSALTKQTIRGTYGPAPGISFNYNQIEVTGTSVGNSNANINLREGGKFTVKSGGVFEINANAIKGASGSSNQQVIVEAGATFKTGNEHGFHGIERLIIPLGTSSIHPNITHIELRPNSTVEYHRSREIQTSGKQTITATLPYHHLVISGNEEKQAFENGVIEIKGNLIKLTNAIFMHNNSTVIFNGITEQDYSSASPQMVFNNLINRSSAGLNVGDSISVLRTLTLEDNSKLNINADITLQSRAESTANVAPIPENATINYVGNSNFIVERYISGPRKAWQFLGVPVYGDQTIHEAWQEGSAPGMTSLNNAPDAAGNIKPGYGTTFTSDRPTWSTDGFDARTAPGPSLKIYNSSSGQWLGVAGTHIPLQNEKGYMLMVRGDRSVIAYDQPANETILRSRGRIYAPGNLPPATLIPNTPGAFVSVGNPYPSAIDFSEINRTNLSESYTIWDPKLTNEPTSSYGLGAYRTISGEVAVPSSGNYMDEPLPPIQSGQAFFVQLAVNAPASGSVSFSENAKTTGSRSIFRGGPRLTKSAAHLRVNLYLAGKEKPVLMDGLLTQLNEAYSAGLDEWDAVKILNPDENIGIVSNGKTLAIERRPLYRQADTLYYSLTGLRKQIYQLELIPNNLEVAGLDTYIEDTYLNQKTLLHSSATTWVNFEVNDDPESFKKNRLRVIFQAAKGPLPVTISQFSAKIKNPGINLEWLTENESGVEKFDVEKSRDGFAFEVITEILGTNEAKNKYQTTDVLPLPGIHYYRLKIIFQNGDSKYSEIIKIRMQESKVSYSINPNPIESGIINLHFRFPGKRTFYLRILNSMGQIIHGEKTKSNGEIMTKKIDVNQQSQGFYFLEIIPGDGEKKTLKFWKD